MTSTYQPFDTETDQFIDTTIINDFHEEDLNPYEFLSKLNILTKIRIKLFGSAFLRNYKKDGWKKPLPIFAFRCKKHGLQIGYPIGWKKALLCTNCFREIIVK